MDYEFTLVIRPSYNEPISSFGPELDYYHTAHLSQEKNGLTEKGLNTITSLTSDFPLVKKKKTITHFLFVHIIISYDLS